MAIEYGILSEPSSLATATNKWEMGWAFTIGDRDVRVVGLRVKFPVAQSTVGHLWSSDKVLLASCSITANSAATWAEAYFEEPVILSAGKQYIVSCYNNSSRYYGSVSAFTFSEYFASIQGGRYVSGANNFPANSESNSIYPLIDIVIKQTVNRVLFGSAEFSTEAIRGVSAVKASHISWDADTPDGTSLKVYSKLSNGEYELCDKNGVIAGLTAGVDLSSETLYLKVEMSTEDPTTTPVLRKINLQVFSQSDANALILTFDPGNRNSIQRAAGDITVAYDGTGTLMGEGGPVLAFEHSFTPEGLDPKNDPHDAEHVEIAAIEMLPTFTRVYYSDYSGSGEHVEVTGINMECVLTHVDDI